MNRVAIFIVAASATSLLSALFGCSSAKLDIAKDEVNDLDENCVGCQKVTVRCDSNDKKKTAVAGRMMAFLGSSAVEEIKGRDTVFSFSEDEKKIGNVTQCFLQEGEFSLVEAFCCNGTPRECISAAEKSGKWKMTHPMQLAGNNEALGYRCDVVYVGESVILSNDDVESALVWEGEISNSGASAVLNLNLTKGGERKLQESTKNNIGKHLAFVVDGVALECIKVQAELKNAAVMARVFGRDIEEATGKARCLAAAIEKGPLEKYGEGTCKIVKH